MNLVARSVHKMEMFPFRIITGIRTLALALLTSVPLLAGVRFVDVTKQAGIEFTHNSGRAGKKYLPETMGSGCAFLDADVDGWQDILLLNSKDWSPRGRRSLPKLYRNTRDGKFVDITAASGLAIEMYAMGVAVADYDNDGRDDLYITAIEGDRLFHNEGGGRFRDVTASSGIRNADFGTSVAFLDYDKDGLADIFVANYVRWAAKVDVWCSMDGTNKSYCTPESYKGTSSKLFKNLGGGKFADLTEKAGVADPSSKSLGIAVLDYNNDGWPDLFVANDTQPNKLYRNQGDGSFVDEAVSAGVAFGDDGAARGAMGVDAADYDRSGRLHLFVGNFSNQMLGLYHNQGSGLFVDKAPGSTVGRASMLSLAFAVFFFDFDLDGYLDLFAANGHIDEDINRVQPKIAFAQPPLLFRNVGGKSFEQVLESGIGPDLFRPLVGRGAAYADYDRDGDLDVLITSNHGPAKLLRNDGGNQANWLSIRLVGARSTRSGLGALVRVVSSSGAQGQVVHSGSSYCSQSDLALTFGLGAESKAAAIEVYWPSGAKQRFADVPSNQHLIIHEDQGLRPSASSR